MRGLGARHNSLVSGSPSASPRDNRKLLSYSLVESSERSERDTLRCNAIEISLYLLASERSERDPYRSK